MLTTPSPEHSDTRGRRVLADHKRLGKRFIPPIFQIGGDFRETRWLDRPLPELLWLGLLHQHYGFENGSHVAIALAGAAATVSGAKKHFALASSYLTFDAPQQRRLLRLADEIGVLAPLQSALSDFLSLYPACPLRILLAKSPTPYNVSMRDRFKEFLAPLFYRHDRQATLIAGTSVAIGLATGRMHFARSVSPPNWLALAAYDQTDESRRVGASVRAAFNIFFEEPFYDPSTEWPSYFWDRGLELEPCSLKESSLDDA